MKHYLLLLMSCLPLAGMQAQCTIAIPPNAIVVDTTMGSSGVGKVFWICKNDTLTGSGVDMTYFMEQGSAFSGSGIDKNVYMKTLSSISGSGIDDSIWHEAGVSISISNPFTMLCPAIVFDYADAPVPGCPVATGVAAQRDLVRVTVFPNPATSHVTIGSEPGNPLGRIHITDMKGRLVKEITRPGGWPVRIGVSGWEDGLYIIRIETAQGTAVHFLTVSAR